ncbi:NlpC/P60 family protein [Kitasatospora kifunensis]|uniref:NlpC/P60 domain-containing protein n=1 Tax=Kitasatospora kifunensis TaxID=58351 RepID=A0A7W7VZY9_KITKI|nr:NlpC/P60 family protein [Kitasatospora kifunensis]MBB4929056.1 hypothetical protein [Kitasatospora kifunensis]
MCSNDNPSIVTAPLIAAQIEAESGWDPNAKSSQGAEGLSQFTPATWTTVIPGSAPPEPYGQDEDGNTTPSPYDPPDAIMAQARYDCYLSRLVNDELKSGAVQGDPLDLTLASYNAGPDAVKRAGGVPKIVETQGYVQRIRQLLAKYTASMPTTTQGGGTFGAQVIKAAEQWLGTPYSWGGGGIDGPGFGTAQGAFTKGFDCSSLVQYSVYQASGDKLIIPRVSEDQVNAGQEVSRNDMQPGDVIGFATKGSGDYSHIAIYIGNGQIVHAPHTGDVVKISNLSDFQDKDWEIRRFG